MSNRAKNDTEDRTCATVYAAGSFAAEVIQMGVTYLKKVGAFKME